MPYSRYLALLGLLLLIVLALPVGLVLRVDPFQIFHKATYPVRGFSHNQRFQNAGLINSHLADPAERYDSIMVGTSISANFSQSSMKEHLGWNRTMRLVMEGALPIELSALLSHALRQADLQHVLIEIFPIHFWGPEIPDTGAYPAEFPWYLYSQNPFDRLRYIFNVDTLKQAYLLHAGYTNLMAEDEESMGRWAGTDAMEKSHLWLNSAEGLANLKQSIPQQMIPYSREERDALSYPDVDTFLLPILQQLCNQPTEVVLYITPQPVARYLYDETTSRRVAYLPGYILRKTRHCSNVRLHAFDTLPFTNDLANYMDHHHFNLSYSEWILARIGKGEYRLTPDNTEAYEIAFIDKVNRYTPWSSLVPGSLERSGPIPAAP